MKSWQLLCTCRTQVGICHQDKRYQWCQPKDSKDVTVSSPLSDLQWHLCEAQQGFTWDTENYGTICHIVVQSLSRVWLLATPWTAAHQVPLSFTVSQSLLKFMSIQSVMPSNHLILCCPLLLLPLVFPSIRVFPNESALCIRWPKYWSSSFSISPSNEYSGLISFKIDWIDLLAVQGILKHLLQHHSLNAKSPIVSFYNQTKS